MFYQKKTSQKTKIVKKVELRDNFKNYIPPIDIPIPQITTFIKVCMAFVFGLQTLLLMDFSKIYQLKGLEHFDKGHTNFYECCDLTTKYI